MMGTFIFGATLGFGLLFASAAHAAPPQSAAPAAPQSSERVIAPLSGVQAPETLNLALNKSEVLRVSESVTRIAVGNPDIADAVALTERSFYVLGKAMGTTNISVYGQNGRLLAVVDVVVGIDVEGVKGAMHSVLPHDDVEVRSVNDSIVLTGVLDSTAKINRVLEIAKTFAGNKVINDLRVSGAQQVMLQVRIAEMQRTFTRAIGFKPFASLGHSNQSGLQVSTLDPGNFNPLNLSAFAQATGQFIAGSLNIMEAIDLLETKGIVKILAEPNLVAMSGDTANFLAGGEFPVPVAQTLNGGVPTVTVEFKPFGVSLAFTPTVIDKDLINLVVAPEVSQLDRSNAVTFAGFTIPGISTRRAKTSVELRDGQSFAIAGLLSSDFTDTLSGIPGVMDAPVIGALARSSAYQRNETELVIIITPRLVQPVAAGTLQAPTDNFVPPSDSQIFLMGRSENPDSGLRTRGGGLIGNYGHIIR